MGSRYGFATGQPGGGSQAEPVIGGAVVLSILALAAIALFIFTGTDFGRERVRRLAVDQLNGMVNGIVRIGRVSGDLLSGVTLHDVAITDSSGGSVIAITTALRRFRIARHAFR